MTEDDMVMDGMTITIAYAAGVRQATINNPYG